MKFLLITQWYKPIKWAAPNRTSKIAEYLASKGHQVTVLTGMPSYPTGILPQKYKGKLWCKEKDNRIRILRTYEYPSPNKGVFKRIINSLSFSLSASIATMFIAKQDAVLVSSPSFLSGISGLIAAQVSKADFYFDIRDLWPDSAIELGYLKNKILIKMLKFLEKIYYKRAKFIFASTPGIKRHLVREKIPENKIQVLINSIDTNKFRPKKINRKIYGFRKDDFIVCYVGNHSQIYDLKTVLKAAKNLTNHPQIKFLFVGEGETKEDLIKMSDRHRIKNAIFWPEKDSKEITKIINLSDVGIIPIINLKIFQETIPAKTSEYLGCGKPVIASVSDEVKRLIEISQVGIFFKPGSAKELERAILTLYKNKKNRLKTGLNARKLSLEIFSNTIFYKILSQFFN